MTVRPPIAESIARVDAQALKSTVFYLSKDPLPYRKANFTRPGQLKSSLEEADEYIAKKLRSCGYDVAREPVQEQAFRCDRTKPRHHWYSTPDPGDPWYTLHNVYGKKRGSAKPDEIIVVVSHKDSPSWIDSPGAHDNAVGTAGNLEIARLLAGEKLNRTIWFLFCNEEHTPWSSVTAANNAKSRGDTIVAAFNLDGIGAKSQEAVDAGIMTSAICYTTPEGKALADLMNEVNESYAIGLTQVLHQYEHPANDDGSFVRAGYPAAIGIHGSHPYGDPNYHEPGDIPERVDIANVRLTVQMTLATILTLDAR